MSNLTFNKFKNPQLNALAGELITLNKTVIAQVKEAYDLLGKSVTNRFMSGKKVFDKLPEILEECGSQRAFAKKIGITENVLSNDLRAYRALEERGITTPKDFKKILDQKGLKATVKNWERLPNLLANPDEYKKDQRPKDEKRLEEIYKEVDEIKSRAVTDNVSYEAQVIQDEIVDITKEILMQNPLNMEWENERYLDYIRNYGHDALTGEPLPPETPAHPHHVNPFTGGAGGGEANKLPDCFTIPLHHKNHRAIHDGTTTYSTEEYQEALIKVLTKYIITHVK